MSVSKKHIQGKDIVVFFRNETKNPDAKARYLGFQLDFTLSREKQSEVVEFKGGSKNLNTGEEVSASLASQLYQTDDENLATWRELEKIYEEDDLLGLIIADISNGEGEIETIYTQGLLTTFEISAPQDGTAELSAEYNIDGKPQRGNDILTPEMIEEIEAIQYLHRKIDETGSAG